MYHRVRFDLPRWHPPRSGALFRYAIVDRIGRAGRSRGLDLLAFGFEEHGGLRCVVGGPAEPLGPFLKGVKVGTANALRHAGVGGAMSVMEHREVTGPEAIDAVVWAHRAPLEGPRSPRQPLATPWSSHRDLLGYREAVFFDAKPLRSVFDPQVVHKSCGGKPVRKRRRRAAPRTIDLATLLRIAAAVLGVLPADRRCFGLFVHIALATGWSNRDVARALCLTQRRVRQLAARPAAHVEVAERILTEPRLRRVP